MLCVLGDGHWGDSSHSLELRLLMSHLHTPPHPHDPSYPPPLCQESLYNTITFVTLCPRPACDLALGVEAAGVHTVHRYSLQATQAWHGYR